MFTIWTSSGNCGWTKDRVRLPKLQAKRLQRQLLPQTP